MEWRPTLSCINELPIILGALSTYTHTGNIQAYMKGTSIRKRPLYIVLTCKLADYLTPSVFVHEHSYNSIFKTNNPKSEHSNTSTYRM